MFSEIQCLGYLKGTICEPYLDGVLCYFLTFEEHLQNLQTFLQRLKTRGIKLCADKCNFFKQEVRYLGRLISVNGYSSDPIDTNALEKFRCPPKTIGELRSLLGFLGYYRCYVRFSQTNETITVTLQLIFSGSHLLLTSYTSITC